MSKAYPNTIETVSIDATGEVLRYHLNETHQPRHLIGLNIEGTAAASYAVDVGGQDSGDASVTWFENEATYSSTTSVSDAWEQAEEWLRIRVTTAGSAGSEATVYLARGE